MAKIERLTQLKQKLRKLSKKHPGDSVVVGYTQNYAVYVHENVEAAHNVGQAKYLEQPAREEGKEIGRVVSNAVKAGVPFPMALLLGGLRLQRESQPLVPVDTGALKASGFTAFEDDVDQEAQAAFKRSEEIRERELAKRNQG